VNNTIKVEVAIIGGGPAGLAAAVAAKKAGVSRVIIIERDRQLGGLLYQCVHNGFGLQYFNSDLTGPEYAYHFLNLLENYNIEVYLNSMAIDVNADKEITVINSYDGLLKIKADAIILAMGCRERSRGAINIPGSRPSGIFTAGTAQRFINIEGYFPGKRIVILGSGDIGMIMARRVILENAKVEAVVELMPYVGGLIRNEYQCLRDFNVPLYLSHTVSEIFGNERIEGVIISKVDENYNIIAGTDKKIECDTLLLSVGLIPENELSKTAGIDLDPVIGGPVIDENMQTNKAGIFAAGNVVHVHDLVDYVTLGGEKAGYAAAMYIFKKLKESKRNIYIIRGDNIRYIVPQHIHNNSDVSIHMRVTKPAEKVILKVNDNLFTKKMTMVRPSEMIKLDINTELIRSLKGNELKIDCIEQNADNNYQVDKNYNNKGIEIICLTCPLACRMRVFLDADGGIKKVTHYKCKRGKEFAAKEIKNPERVLTGTLKTNNIDKPLISFRTNNLIPKRYIKKCMRILAGVEINRPVKSCDVIISNILDSGVDIIATMDYSISL